MVPVSIICEPFMAFITMEQFLLYLWYLHYLLFASLFAVLKIRCFIWIWILKEFTQSIFIFCSKDKVTVLYQTTNFKTCFEHELLINIDISTKISNNIVHSRIHLILFRQIEKADGSCFYYLWTIHVIVHTGTNNPMAIPQWLLDVVSDAGSACSSFTCLNRLELCIAEWLQSSHLYFKQMRLDIH